MIHCNYWEPINCDLARGNFRIELAYFMKCIVTDVEDKMSVNGADFKVMTVWLGKAESEVQQNA